MLQLSIWKAEKNQLKQQGGANGKNICILVIKKEFFFPELWTSKEIENWGEQNLEGHEILSNFKTIEF
jgi:hypothetical protein